MRVTEALVIASLIASPVGIPTATAEQPGPYQDLDSHDKVVALRALLERAGASEKDNDTTCVEQFLARNSMVTGRLTTTDCPFDDGTYYDLWFFDGFVGEEVTIDLQSSDFDTFLFLLDPALQVAAYDDDGGEATNSRVHYSLDSSGTWLIIVNNYAPVDNDPGVYTLALEISGVDYSRPAAGNGSGRDGMRWLETLEVCNTGEQDHFLQIELTERGAPGQPRHSTTELVTPHRCRSYENPIQGWFGQEMYGALLIDVDGLAEEVKISGGYRGAMECRQVSEALDTVPLADAIRDDAYLLTSLDSAASRAATGFQVTGRNTSFTISIESPIGTVHWQSAPYSGWMAGDNQLVGQVEQLAPGASNLVIHYHVETGALAPYVAVTDSSTGDTAIRLPAIPLSYAVIPAVGRVTGYGDADWYSELTIANLAAESCNVQLDLYIPRHLTGELILAAGEVVGLADLFGELDWRDQEGALMVPGEGVGALEMRSDREVIAGSRFYSVDRTTGMILAQTVRAMSEPNLIPGKKYYLLGVRNEGEQNLVRARLGFVNMSKREAMVTVRVLHHDGTEAGRFTRSAAEMALSLWRIPTGITERGTVYTLEVTTSVPGYSFLSQISPGNDPSTHYPL